jgi:hypothetical protein
MTQATSPVQIGRMALALLGARSNIESFSEDSDEARKIGLFYDLARRETLSHLDWSFARRTKALAVHADSPTGHFSYRYKLPADFAAVRRILNPLGVDADNPAYEIQLASDQSLTLLTDVGQAELVYTGDITEVTLMSPSFISALAHLLAYYVASDLLGEAGRNKAESLLNRYSVLLAQAASRDANSEPPRPERDARYIRDR